MPMNPRLLRPTSTTHPEAQVWRNAVIANGGTVSGSTLNAVSRFCRSIDAAGIRDRFYRLNLFCGTGLNAVLVPLYRGQSRTGTQLGNTTDTNINFVSGDYVETGASGGLLGNLVSKYLNTGLAPSALPQVATMHVSAYRGAGATLARFLISSRDGTDIFEISRRGDGPHQGVIGLTAAASNVNEPGQSDGGHYIASRTSATLMEFRKNTGLIASNTNSVTPGASAQPLFVFALNNSGTPSERFPHRIMAYSIGDGLTASQADAFYTALQAFQTALGRNV
jgi:hypothetical protein